MHRRCRKGPYVALPGQEEVRIDCLMDGGLVERIALAFVEVETSFITFNSTFMFTLMITFRVPTKINSRIHHLPPFAWHLVSKRGSECSRGLASHQFCVEFPNGIRISYKQH
jgi:hypothetical protein